MSAEVPDTLQNLAQQNTDIVHELGVQDTSVFIESHFAGLLFMEQRYPGYADRTLSQDRLSWPIEPSDRERFERAKFLQTFNPGMILVRPEMVHHSDRIIARLQELGFRVHFVNKTSVDPEAYGRMYAPTFFYEAARPSWPTRTLVYTDSPLMQIVITDPTDRYDETLADGLVRQYKGKGGVRSRKTLRGGVVLEEAIRLGFNTLTNETIAKALDPLQAYRHILTFDGVQPHSHLPPEIQLLHYVAVSVHSPDSSEFARDMSVINDVNTLDQIIHAVGSDSQF